MVDQEIFLFGGTVTENVTMWDPTIAAPRVVTAARDAAIDEVIAAREGGYQSRIQEGGGNFSGGQCQRLEIARALVGEPTIVVMDEATSALDPTTEMLIDESMRRRGCTTIIIAHRLSTIRDSDEIVVMERGKIVQRGTHDEMKDVDGPVQAPRRPPVPTMPASSVRAFVLRVVASESLKPGDEIRLDGAGHRRPRAHAPACGSTTAACRASTPSSSRPRTASASAISAPATASGWAPSASSDRQVAPGQQFRIGATVFEVRSGPGEVPSLAPVGPTARGAARPPEAPPRAGGLAPPRRRRQRHRPGRARRTP